MKKSISRLISLLVIMALCITLIPSAFAAEASEEPEAPKSIKILAIGNSFSTDCMQYLYRILQTGGVEQIILGNLYYGGCSLEQHLDFATNDSKVYTYYKNTSGGWSTQNQYTAADAIADEEWDYISLQQTSKTCGLTSSYGATLTSLVDYVQQHAPNAKLVWNMTWAYQQDSTHTSFPNYNNDQMTMYNMIIDCVNTCILPESRFDIVIPCMTSIQNARTSFLGDTLTRDGYHMDLYIGRYIAALTWYCALTGRSPETVSYNPSTSQISDDMLAVARESVSNAIKTWDKVTASQITEGERGSGESAFDPDLILNPVDFYEADQTLAAQNNIDLSKYQLFTWDYEENGYWNCSKDPSISHPAAGKSTYHQNVCTKVVYSIEDIPAGSIFICDDGWQYRPEIFEKKDGEYKKYTGTRPGMISDSFFVLTEEFLDNCQGIAWNISSNPKEDISSVYAQAACHVRIYVPVQEHEHTYGEWTQITAPDCTHTGEQQRVCECGDIERQTLPATGHALTEVAELAATTQTTGMKKHWKCSSCGKLYADAAGTTEVSEADLIIPRVQEEDTPKTGDATALAGIGLALLLSTMSLVCLYAGKKDL